MTLGNDEVRLTPIGHGVALARALYRQHVKAERTNEEFLSDGREEAARDAGDAPNEENGAKGAA